VIQPDTLHGFIETVCPIVRHHHERLDGGGYPDASPATTCRFLRRSSRLSTCSMHSPRLDRIVTRFRQRRHLRCCAKTHRVAAALEDSSRPSLICIPAAASRGDETHIHARIASSRWRLTHSNAQSASASIQGCRSTKGRRLSTVVPGGNATPVSDVKN
jgi:hypothetical protein